MDTPIESNLNLVAETAPQDSSSGFRPALPWFSCDDAGAEYFKERTPIKRKFKGPRRVKSLWEVSPISDALPKSAGRRRTNSMPEIIVTSDEYDDQKSPTIDHWCQESVDSAYSSTSEQEQSAVIPIGHNGRLHEETRRTLKSAGLFPAGPPAPPTWTHYVSPQDAKPITRPETWSYIDLEEVSRDPFFAPIIGPWTEKYPQILKLKLNLPISKDPFASFFPNLLELPYDFLLYEKRFVQQTDSRQPYAPPTIETVLPHPIIAWYREVWNQNCARRQAILGWEYQTDWNWASCYFPRADENVLKDNPPPSELPVNGDKMMMNEVMARYVKLLKGFYKMPRAIGPWGAVVYPKPEPMRTPDGKVHPNDDSHYY